MATYYVGSSAAGAADGSSWANRFGTLNAAEDVPVVAGDEVVIGPGTYQEILTEDVSGGAGNVITYTGDVTGRRTDGVGGRVIVTASDNGQTWARTLCIDNTAGRSYRTYRGLWLHGGSLYGAQITNGTNITFEDCAFTESDFFGIYAHAASISTITVNRCCFMWGEDSGVAFYHNADIANVSSTIQDSIFIGNTQGSVATWNIGGIAVNGCSFLGGDYGVRIREALAGGSTVTVNNCLFTNLYTALIATVAGEIVENYNNLFNNNTDRTNTNIGANSTAYPPYHLPPLLVDGGGYKLPWWFGDLANLSALRRITGTGATTEDMYGQVRPATAAKRSWGGVQYYDVERDAVTTHNNSTASLKLADAGQHQTYVPCQAGRAQVSVRVYREGNYTGTAPQMIIRQPGQTARTTTDTGGVGMWNTLSDSFTVAGDPDFFIVEFVSNNTAVAGNYDVFFDTLDVRIY